MSSMMMLRTGSRIARRSFVSLARLAPVARTLAAPAMRATSTPMPAAASLRVRLFQTTSMRLNEELIVKLPPVADSISEGEVGSFEKNVGDFVNADEAVINIETDKTNVNVNAPKAGVITQFLVAQGDTVPIGAPLFTMRVTDEKPADAPAAKAAAPAKKAEAAPAPAASAPAPAASAPAPAASAPKKEAPKPAAKAEPADSKGGEGVFTTADGVITRVKMTRMRLRTAERLKESQNSAAMLTTFNEIDMSHIMEFRNKHKDAVLKKHNVKLGFMSVFCKAAAFALKREPAVNAFIDSDGKHIVYHDYVNIAVAVATPKGLVVPVLRNVEKQSYVDIERSIAEVGNKARGGDLALEDMEGGTFTISNGGVFGSLMGTPIINPPQSAILGMHGIFDRPVAVNGKVEIRPMMYVALTYDHRIIDGREAVTFLRTIKEAVEDPRIILLD